MPTAKPRTIRTMLDLLLEMAALLLFQIMYGTKATRKGIAYSSVLTTSLPDAIIKTTGTNTMASTNSIKKTAFSVFRMTFIQYLSSRLLI